MKAIVDRIVNMPQRVPGRRDIELVALRCNGTDRLFFDTATPGLVKQGEEVDVVGIGFLRDRTPTQVKLAVK